METQSTSKHTLRKQTCYKYGEDKEEVGEAGRENNTKLKYFTAQAAVKKRVFGENKEDAEESQSASQTNFTSEEVLLAKKDQHAVIRTGNYSVTNQNGSVKTDTKVKNVVNVSGSIIRIGDKEEVSSNETVEEVSSNETVEEKRNITGNPRTEPVSLKLENINTKFIQMLIDVLDKNNSHSDDLRKGFEDNKFESSQTIQNLNKENETLRQEISKLLEEHLRKQEKFKNHASSELDHKCKEYENQIRTLKQHLYGDRVKTTKSSTEYRRTRKVEANDDELDSGMAADKVENVVRKRTGNKQEDSSSGTLEDTGSGDGNRNPHLLKNIVYGIIAFVGISVFAISCNNYT